MELNKTRPSEKKLIEAVLEIDASREWLNDKLVNWDEGPLPENMDEIWFEGWKSLFPRMERSDLEFREIYHAKNKEVLFLATFRRYLESAD